jgi:hypothetical protein
VENWSFTGSFLSLTRRIKFFKYHWQEHFKLQEASTHGEHWDNSLKRLYFVSPVCIYTWRCAFNSLPWNWAPMALLLRIRTPAA